MTKRWRKILLEQMIRPNEGSFSPELAAHILSMSFPPDAHARYEELSAKIGRGGIPQGERAELEELVTMNTLLATMKSKARLSLRRQNPAA
jgi:hypothetical protein